MTSPLKQAAGKSAKRKESSKEKKTARERDREQGIKRACGCTAIGFYSLS